ncbi:MAG: PKD domain-containing protein, partial [Bacteroidales bacterium]|nr:PKD domain-containing protein [Bacteroidales bacterium]
MKKLNLLILLLFLAIVSFSDSKITRGPVLGEIYFIGPTNTGYGLYYSTNFGQTAVCVDNTFTSSIMSITADKTPGVIYYATMGEGLYISYDFGNIGTWQLRSGGIEIQINSGRQDGFIYSGFSKHSENFGNNFINHSCNGFFGGKIDVELDNKENVGYIIVNKWGVNDTLYLLRSDDNFENLITQKKFLMGSSNFIKLSRGNQYGELFLLNRNSQKLYYSDNYGTTWIINNKFNPSIHFDDIVGGRSNGEIYMSLKFINMMWQNAHTYILHSTDYGVTFEVFHPFAKGQEPVLANFSTTSTEGNQPLSVEFCNFSIGNIQLYEWDFDNDGIIDSNEESPSWTYTEPGTYSVSLKITAGSPDSTNTFVKENYITVLSGNSQEIDLNSGYQFISSNRSPENPDMLEVLGNNLNDNLGFVRNSQGQMLQNIGGNWVNGIGDWINTEGYLFKMNEADVLIIDGIVVNPQTPIE